MAKWLGPLENLDEWRRTWSQRILHTDAKKDQVYEIESPENNFTGTRKRIFCNIVDDVKGDAATLQNWLAKLPEVAARDFSNENMQLFSGEEEESHRKAIATLYSLWTHDTSVASLTFGLIDLTNTSELNTPFVRLWEEVVKKPAVTQTNKLFLNRCGAVAVKLIKSDEFRALTQAQRENPSHIKLLLYNFFSDKYTLAWAYSYILNIVAFSRLFWPNSADETEANLQIRTLTWFRANAVAGTMHMLNFVFDRPLPKRHNVPLVEISNGKYGAVIIKWKKLVDRDLMNATKTLYFTEIPVQSLVLKKTRVFKEVAEDIPTTRSMFDVAYPPRDIF